MRNKTFRSNVFRWATWGAAALAAALLLPASEALAHRVSVHSGGSHGSFSGAHFSHSGPRGTARVGVVGPRGTFHWGSRGPWYGRGHHRSSWWGWGYPYWSAGWWWGGPYWSGYWTHGAYAPYGSVRVATGRYAVIDTDVSPEEAEVWLDGKLIGTADDFDGNPDYLYLRPGKYHVEFRLPGYETYATDIEVARGQKVDFNQKLKAQPGHRALDSFPPSSKGTPMGRVFGPGAVPDTGGSARQARVEVEEDEDLPPPRGRDRIGRWDDEQQPERPAPRRFEARPPRSDRAFLKFKVTPDDAAIYLDDKYLGQAEDLSDRRRGPAVDAGKHTVTVTRPGYKTKTIDVEPKAGASIDVVVELEK